MILSRAQYWQILMDCSALKNKRGVPSSFIYETIELLCESHKSSSAELSALRSEYISETDIALRSLKEYALSVDNWKVEGCLFGLKDQCAILSILLGRQEENFERLSGNFQSAQQIYRLLQEWKGLNISSQSLK